MRSVLVLPVLLAGAALSASGQTSALWVTLIPMPAHDVQIAFATGPLTRPVDFGAVARRTLGCDWTEFTAGRRITRQLYHVIGTCKLLLKIENTRGEGSLRLASLASGLHDAGFRTVYLDIGFQDDVNDSAPHVNGWLANSEQAGWDSYVFESRAGGPPPPPFPIQLKFQPQPVPASSRRPGQLIPLHPFDPTSLIVPLLAMAIIPAAIAFTLRQRAGQGAIYAWSRWLLAGLWLYWIEAVNLGNIAAFATGPWFHHASVSLLVGVLLYALPPSTATAVCLSALAPRRGAWVQFAGLLVHAPAAAVVFSLLFVGYRLYESAPWVWMASIPCSLLVMQAANRLTSRKQASQIRKLDAGEFRERVMELARRAGVSLRAVYVQRNREAGMESATAMPSAGLLVTEGLLAHSTRREMDASVAHELAALCGRYQRALKVATVVTTLACMAYIPVLAFTDRGDTIWGRTLPLTLLLCLLLPAQLSQRQALAADVRSAGLTGDPEGLIAALGRVSRLNHNPLAWGSTSGALLPLPSPKRRALALAHRFSIPQDRAVALLERPEILAADVGYAQEAGIQRLHPAYNAGSLSAHVLSLLRWMRVFLIVGSLLLYMAVAALSPAAWRLVAYLCGVPLLFWLYLETDRAMDRRFLRRMERRAGANGDGILVGLRCGGGAGDPYPWDLGRLSLTAEGLVYLGERARFRVSRERITGIDLVTGPFSWERHHLVAVHWMGGNCTLEPTLGLRSRRKVRLFEAQLQAWWRGETAPHEVAGAETLALPDLPPVPWQPLARRQIATRLALRAGGLLLVSTLSMMMLDIARVNLFALPNAIRISSLVTTPIPLTPAAIYLLAALPSVFWKRR